MRKIGREGGVKRGGIMRKIGREGRGILEEREKCNYEEDLKERKSDTGKY